MIMFLTVICKYGTITWNTKKKLFGEVNVMMVRKRSSVCLFCFIFLIAFLLTSCIYSPEENFDATITETPDIAQVPDDVNIQEPIPAPSEAVDNIVTVHNARELLANMVSGRHILLVPGGDYDLASISLASCIFYGLENVTLEGMGDTPVTVQTKNMDSVVMSFSNCRNIKLINLELSHTPPVSPNVNCRGKVLVFESDSTDITIKNCILSGCGIIGLYAYNSGYLLCEDTIIRDCSMSILDLNRATRFTFIRCTFEGDNARVINLKESRDILFKECLFTSEYWLPYVQVGDWRPFENEDHDLYAKTINMDQPEQGILIKNSLMARYEYADLCRQLRDSLSSLLLTYPFEIEISLEETLGGTTIFIKTTGALQNIQEEYQLLFDNIMQSMETLELRDVRLHFEMEPIFAAYPNIDALLKRYRNGENVSFWETDSIYFGNLDAGLIDPESNQYLSIQQACNHLLRKVPLPVSTSNYEPYISISDVVTGEPSLIYTEGHLLYYFKDFSYGVDEFFGFDGFCIDAKSGTLHKIHDGKYVEVSSADKKLISEIVNYLENNGAVIAPNDRLQVQVYDDEIVSVDFGAKVYFELKMTKTPEGSVFKPYRKEAPMDENPSKNNTERSNSVDNPCPLCDELSD